MKKVILISGGSDGLGKEIAKQLSSTHTVVIISPHKKKVEQTAQELACDFGVCNITDYMAVENIVSETLRKYSRVDCLINNAGLWIEGELDENDPARIREVIEVNSLGTVYFSQAVIPHMKKQTSGLIINIISQAGLYAKAKRTVYNMTKWGITGFTKSLQAEVAEYGIGVTGIYPGKMKTRMFEKNGYS